MDKAPAYPKPSEVDGAPWPTLCAPGPEKRARWAICARKAHRSATESHALRGSHGTCLRYETDVSNAILRRFPRI